MRDYLQDFRSVLGNSGLSHSSEIITDGKLHRFKAADDTARNSWYVLFPSNSSAPAAGAFGCWKRGIKETWCEARDASLSDSAWQTIREGWKIADEERKRTEIERHAKARKIATWILDHSKPVVTHDYLTAKGLKVAELFEYRGAVVLPLRNANGELHSLQFISADGTKRFLSGGQIAGCFLTLADNLELPLAVCEGYATGASVHEATGFAVVCAMNCGNLLAVSKAMRERFPAREIIVCADNDAWTDSNPGLTKATEAAKAIHAKIAVPQFAVTNTKPTDFNDMARLEGIEAVKKQIATSGAVKETDDEVIARLATLPRLDYERQRDAAANSLGCRAAVLDKLVDAARPNGESESDGLQGQTLKLDDVELWPEAVSGVDLLSHVSATFARYVALPDGAADALALWVAHSHCFDAFVCSPRLNISSPEKGCGKTTLRDVVTALVPRPLATENLTTAVLFRVIEAHKPTILADECDAWLRDNEELRGMLNAGHRRGGKALRCEGESNEIRAFNVYAPSVLCGIGSLPGTLHDRSIIVRLERAKPGELLSRFDSRRIEPEIELCRKLARFCADNKARIEACEPALPSGAVNRLADNWRPLFAIAEIAGGDWPQRVASAFAKLTAKADSDAQGMGAMLLADIRQVINGASLARMLSKALVEALCEMSDRPWPEAHRGRPVTENWLARRLRTFGIVPRTVRTTDGRGKGYEAADFADAFARYLPPEGESNRDTVTSAVNIDDSLFSNRDTALACHGS